MKKKEITPAEALLKMEQYCGFQERCASEVRTKLYAFGINGASATTILEHLEAEGFLDEERFVRTFARSKFRQNHWGRVRIRMELKKRRISERLIGIGLSEIDETEYAQKIIQLYQQKLRALPDENPDNRIKAIHFLLQKGYESEVVRENIGRS